MNVYSALGCSWIKGILVDKELFDGGPFYPWVGTGAQATAEPEKFLALLGWEGAPM